MSEPNIDAVVREAIDREAGDIVPRELRDRLLPQLTPSQRDELVPVGLQLLIESVQHRRMDEVLDDVLR